MSEMPRAVIVEAVRTARGKKKGSLAGTHPMDLAAHVLKAAIRRVGEALLARRAEIAQGWLLESSMIVGASCCGPRRASAFEWIRARCRTALALLQRTILDSADRLRSDRCSRLG